ncbi:hypothetical protein [Syntrophomonas wolfei]|uniref:hypothetical protein n=1 Tax=Syntrophomonas wolfei TaxID=863 RepID=UPI0013654949|nr:hypothetical protein [Syntrophomonas wolfei]
MDKIMDDDLKKFIQFFRQAGAAVNIQFLKYRPQRGMHRAFRCHPVKGKQSK